MPDNNPDNNLEEPAKLPATEPEVSLYHKGDIGRILHDEGEPYTPMPGFDDDAWRPGDDPGQSGRWTTGRPDW